MHGHNQAFAIMSNESDSFKKRAVCPKCNSLYTFGECVQRIRGVTNINMCSYKFMRSYPRCGEQLMRKIVSSSGHAKYYPHSVYCFTDLITSLQSLIMRPGFAQLCESTRSTYQSNGYGDVYDGLIWKNFQTPALLSAPNNYALLLNVDWLQPFEHITYSVGVIYAAILNLPRSIRFKRENIILLGVIPGPSEPSLTINTYLSPIISDLLDLWKGIPMTFPDSCDPVVVKCVLIGVSCDLPAARKICGFLSHSANLGCSMCYTEFSEGFGQRNYSNFNRDSWKKRTNSQHRSDVEKIRKAKTKTERTKLESEFGCRYSVLLDLPYFDPVNMLLIDPMHNLFLGTAKHLTLDILVRRGILSTENLNQIEQRLKNVHVPTGLGRLPSRIDVGKFLTAEQWKNWTIFFSVYCLHDLLPEEQLECWRHFVLACRRLCKFHVSNDDLTIADALLLKFCKRVCRIYGSDALTPNFHLHCHLVSCIKNFGPFHSFWLFPFERYNGILGSQPNNNRSVELQFIRRFQRDNSHLQMIHQAKTWPHADLFLNLTFSNSSKLCSEEFNTEIKPGSKSTICALSEDHMIVLKHLYSTLYPEYSHQLLSGEIIIPTVYRKYSYIIWKGHRLKSTSHENSMNPYILASPTFEFTTHNVDIYTVCQECFRPAKIESFILHSIQLSASENPISHLLAFCLWPMEHPEHFRFGKPVEVWCRNLYEPSSSNAIIPVSSFCNPLIISNDVISEECILITIPLL